MRQNEIEALKTKLSADKTTDLQRFKDEVIEILENEIVSRYYYQNGRIEVAVKRDPYIINSIEVLKKHDTDLMVIKENIPSLKTSMGQFFISILGSVYTLERNLTSERTKDVIKNKKKSGKVYSRTPFGFDKVDDKLVKNPYEQKVLRKIKSLRKKGSSYLSISRFLNRNNHKTKMGKKWSKENVYSLLKINRNIIGLSSIGMVNG